MQFGMKYLEDMHRMSKQAEDHAEEIRKLLAKLGEPSKQEIARDMWDTRETPLEAAKMTAVIVTARALAETRLSAMTVELETLSAALDDAIGKAGRLF